MTPFADGIFMLLDPQDEQRDKQRVLIKKSFKVLTPNGHTAIALVHDITIGGAKLDWSEACAEEDSLSIFFSTDLCMEAQVRWCRKMGDHYEVGVSFSDLEDIAALYLGEYIEALDEYSEPEF